MVFEPKIRVQVSQRQGEIIRGPVTFPRALLDLEERVGTTCAVDAQEEAKHENTGGYPRYVEHGSQER